tara:strand:+ start:2829 stop:3083 length:255 start_codon:yes stop_codon:yes gene_type:complete
MVVCGGFCIAGGIATAFSIGAAVYDVSVTNRRAQEVSVLEAGLDAEMLKLKNEQAELEQQKQNQMMLLMIGGGGILLILLMVLR